MTPVEIRAKVLTYMQEALRLANEEGDDFNEELTAVLANLYLAMDAHSKGNMQDACDELSEAEAILFESDD